VEIKMMRIAMLVATLALVTGPQASGLQDGTISLVIGEGLNEPFGVDVDAAGRLFIVEMGGHRVSVLEPDGARRVLAGTGEKGFSGDGGPAIEARFNGPHHLLLGPDGHLYVADTFNNCVRRIDLKTGRITRVAGTGEKGFSGDGGPAVDARFGGIYAMAFRGRMLYICDLDSRRIRAMSLDTGIVSTVAGNGEKGVPRDGEDARTQPLVDPRAVAVDDAGAIYICERGGHALRVVDSAGRIRTVAGNGEAGYAGDGGPARAARLNGPKHISVDPRGDVLITDTENHVIRRYSPRDGTIARVTGTGVMGADGVGGPPLSCALNRPHGATTDPRTGLLYVSDSENHRVLRLAASPRAAPPQAAAAPAVAAPTAEGFVPLFNGRDLTGWHNINCAAGTFTARDGEIYSTGKPICEIRTERMYENFVLELEYQHLKAGGNAGVFVWTDALPARGEPFLRAIEVQVLDGQETANYTSHGDVFAIHGAVMTPDRPHPAGWMRSLPKERRARPAGEWNHYRITADKGAITLAVNGREVSGGRDISPRKGYLALESEGSPVRFRNLRIRELPSAGALPPAQVATADAGFVSLYNGQDVTGWIQRDRALRWKADDWTLKAVGPAAAASADLVSSASYGDVVVMADWRLPAAPPAPNAVTPPSSRAGGPSPHAGARFVIGPQIAPSARRGEWHRTIATIRGSQVSITVDGQALADRVRPPGFAAKAPIVLLHGEGVEYANIFVKPLP
jgi:DNA-binding beta-propeller fold protein YncE